MAIIYCYLEEENDKILKFHFIYLFIYLFIYFFVCLFIYLFIYLFIVQENSISYISKVKKKKIMANLHRLITFFTFE